MSLNPEQEAAAETITDVVQSLGDTIGPQALDEGDAPEPDDSLDGWVLSDWVMVANWTSLRTGETWTTRIGKPGMAMTTRTGLLHEALFNMGD